TASRPAPGLTPGRMLRLESRGCWIPFRGRPSGNARSAPAGAEVAERRAHAAPLFAHAETRSIEAGASPARRSRCGHRVGPAHAAQRQPLGFQAVVAEEVHEAQVVRLGDPESGQQALVAAAGSGQTFGNDVADLGA